MTLVRPILTSFNGGEISSRMMGRVDTAIYQVALETCENFVPTVEGPIVKCPGFEIITAAAPSAGWLSTFRFNLTQDYAIEWSEGALRFFTNGVRIETTPGVPYEVAVPYTAAEARFVSAQQSYDRLYLDHPNHPPARLTRTSATTFAYDVPPLLNGPFADANSDTGVTVTASATTGAVTLTASAPIFLPGHAAALFRIEAADFSAVPAWQVGIDGVAIGAKRRNEGKVYVAASAGRTGTVAPIHSSGTEQDGSPGNDINAKGPYGVSWTYLYDHFGIVRIDTVTSGTAASGTVLRTLPDSVVASPSFRWAHAFFSAAAGWPSVVRVWRSRLVHFKLFDVVASVSGDYLNHAAFTASGTITSDLAFRRTLSSENPVLWAAGDRKLLVGTADCELAIGPVNAAAALSGDNIAADPQSFYGSARVFPLQAGTSTFFVQRGGRKLREAQYEFGQDRYTAANATVWARHITAGGLIQLAFQKEPEELLIGVRGDGQMMIHPHQPEQEIKGFARRRHSDGLGKILSAVTIASADGQRDELWVLAQRTDTGFKSIERMAAWRDDGDPIEGAFFVDSGITGTAAPNQTHFTGFAHLAGMPVQVLAAGGVVPGIVVAADGSFDLPATSIPADVAFTVTAGLKYTATCVTLRPELKLQGETSQGKRQRLVKIVLRLLETVGIRVGPKDGRLDELVDRPAGSAMDAPIPLYTGDSQRAVSGGYSDGGDGRGMIVSDAPLPATVICAMPQIDVEPPK